MQQQSTGLQGCTSNPGPLLSGRRAVASTWGVSARAARPDLYAVKQHGTSSTEVHVLDGNGRFTAWQAHFSTIAGPTTPSAWDFAVADRNRDGVDDVIGIKRSGGASGTVEVHVLDGASGYRSWQLHAATVLPATTSALWAFDAADVDQDGQLDVVGVNRSGSAGRTTVHVLDGAAGYASYLLHAGTVLPHTDTSWTFVTGDHDRDGRPDLYAIDRVGASGNAEVHVLDGASRFTERSARAVTPIPDDGASWTFTTDDFDADGWDEVVGVKRDGASGRTEVHVLAGRTYSSFVSSAQTPLPVTDGEPGWRFVAD